MNNEEYLDLCLQMSQNTVSTVGFPIRSHLSLPLGAFPLRTAVHSTCRLRDIIGLLWASKDMKHRVQMRQNSESQLFWLQKALDPDHLEASAQLSQNVPLVGHTALSPSLVRAKFQGINPMASLRCRALKWKQWILPLSMFRNLCMRGFIWLLSGRREDMQIYYTSELESVTSFPSQLVRLHAHMLQAKTFNFCYLLSSWTAAISRVVPFLECCNPSNTSMLSMESLKAQEWHRLKDWNCSMRHSQLGQQRLGSLTLQPLHLRIALRHKLLHCGKD